MLDSSSGCQRFSNSWTSNSQSTIYSVSPKTFLSLTKRLHRELCRALQFFLWKVYVCRLSTSSFIRFYHPWLKTFASTMLFIMSSLSHIDQFLYKIIQFWAKCKIARSWLSSWSSSGRSTVRSWWSSCAQQLVHSYVLTVWLSSFPQSACLPLSGGCSSFVTPATSLYSYIGPDHPLVLRQPVYSQVL